MRTSGVPVPEGPVLGEADTTMLWSNAVTAVIVAGGAAVIQWLRTRQETQAKAAAAHQETSQRAEVATNEEYRKLVRTYEARLAKLEKRCDTQDEQMDRLADTYRKVLIAEARCLERVGRYEEALRAAGIPFQPYEFGGGNSRVGDGGGVGESDAAGPGGDP